jgi:hypothetical protein
LWMVRLPDTARRRMGRLGKRARRLGDGQGSASVSRWVRGRALGNEPGKRGGPRGMPRCTARPMRHKCAIEGIGIRRVGTLSGP